METILRGERTTMCARTGINTQRRLKLVIDLLMFVRETRSTVIKRTCNVNYDEYGGETLEVDTLIRIKHGITTSAVSLFVPTSPRIGGTALSFLPLNKTRDDSRARRLCRPSRPVRTPIKRMMSAQIIVGSKTIVNTRRKPGNTRRLEHRCV